MTWRDAMLDIIHNAKTLDEAREMAEAALTLAGAISHEPPADTRYRARAKIIAAAYKGLAQRIGNLVDG